MQQNAFSLAFSKYKKIQKETNCITKTKDNIIGLLQSQKVYNKKVKNVSSIKSIIKRLQLHGNIKINYTKIRSRNDRPDIFLQGGQINNLKQIDLLQNQEEKQIQKKLQERKSTFEFTKSDKNFISTKINYKKHKKSISKQHCKTTSDKFSKTQTEENFRQKHTNLFQTKKNMLQSKTNKNFIYQRSRKTQSDSKPTKTLNLKEHLKIKSNQQVNFNQNYFTQKIQSNRPLFYLSQKQISCITAQSFIVSQYQSGKIVTGNKFKQITQIASLTKIVTFYVCLRLIQIYELDIDKQSIVIDQFIQLTSGTTAELLQGDQFTIRTLFYGLMLPSGNDAALALAKWGGKILLKQDYSNEKPLLRFLKFMNQQCQKIQMKSSYFGNPHGLPHSKNGSTAQDMAILISKALQFPLFREVIKTKIYKCWVKNEGVLRQVVWQNTNKLLRRNGFIGVKTGVTVTAGPCLATCYQSGDKIYIIVVLGTSKLSRRFKETRMILGKVLFKIRGNRYTNEIKQIQKNNSDLDSDNSQDEQQFNYQRKDLFQMQKRMRIIVNQM